MLPQSDKPRMHTGVCFDPADRRGPNAKDRGDWLCRHDDSDVADLDISLRHLTRAERFWRGRQELTKTLVALVSRDPAQHWFLNFQYDIAA